MVGARGKTERKLASPTQNQSSPAQYFHSHPGRATFGGDTFFPAKMYKLISRHHGAHTPQHEDTHPRYILPGTTLSCTCRETHSQKPSPRGAQPIAASALCHLVLERRGPHPEPPTQGQPDWREGPGPSWPEGELVCRASEGREEAQPGWDEVFAEEGHLVRR